MGKQRGAKFAHEGAVNWSFREMIPQIARIHLDNLPVVGGIAVVEDQHDDTTILEEVRAARVTDTMRLERLYVSKALLEEARDRNDLRVVGEPE